MSIEDKQVITRTNKPLRNDKGYLLPGHTANPAGRPVKTDEQKLTEQVIKKRVDEHLAGLADALPKIRPILIKKAEEGDISAIKDVEDRVMGKPAIQEEKKGGDVNIYIWGGYDDK